MVTDNTAWSYNNKHVPNLTEKLAFVFMWEVGTQSFGFHAFHGF